MFCLGGFCPGGFWQGGFLSRGFLARGVFVQGVFCPGVYVRGVIVRGVFVLEPGRSMHFLKARFKNNSKINVLTAAMGVLKVSDTKVSDQYNSFCRQIFNILSGSRVIRDSC